MFLLFLQTKPSLIVDILKKYQTEALEKTGNIFSVANKGAQLPVITTTEKNNYLTLDIDPVV